MRFFILLQKAYLPLIHTHTQLFSIIFCPEIQQDFYNTLINRYFSGLVALRWKPKAIDNRKKGRTEKKARLKATAKDRIPFYLFFPFLPFFSFLPFFLVSLFSLTLGFHLWVPPVCRCHGLGNI